MKKYSVIIFTLLGFTLLNAEFLTFDKVIKNMKGIKSFEKGEYEEAESKFQENALENPHEGTLHFNQGNALFKSGKLEDAENSYNLALRDKNFKSRSQTLQNLGNVKFEQKDYKDAINNYRNSLIEDPNNLDARYNYELAARMLQRQQEQEQQQDQNQDKDNEDENKDKKKQEQKENKDEQKQDQQKQKQQDKKEDEKEKQEQQKMKKEKDKKKEDAEKMLKMLLQKEKEEMKKEKMKLNTDKHKSGKYW